MDIHLNDGFTGPGYLQLLARNGLTKKRNVCRHNLEIDRRRIPTETGSVGSLPYMFSEISWEYKILDAFPNH